MQNKHKFLVHDLIAQGFITLTLQLEQETIEEDFGQLEHVLEHFKQNISLQTLQNTEQLRHIILLLHLLLLKQLLTQVLGHTLSPQTSHLNNPTLLLHTLHNFPTVSSLVKGFSQFSLNFSL